MYKKLHGANEEGDINELGILKYTITVSNSGTEVARDVVITDKLPNWTNYVRSNYETNTSYMNVETFPANAEDLTEEVMKNWNVVQNGNVEKGEAPTLQWIISEINPGESVTEKFEVLTGMKPDLYTYYKDFPGFTIGEDGKYYITTTTYNADTDTTSQRRNEITSIPQIDLKNIATVTASNFAVELQAQEKIVELKNTNFQFMENLSVEGEAEIGEEIRYNIVAVNMSNEDLTNVSIEKVLPEGLKFQNAYYSVFDKETLEPTNFPIDTYDEETRKIIATKDTFPAHDSFTIQISAIVQNLPEGVYEKEIKGKSILKGDNLEEIESNETSFVVKKPGLVANLESSIKNEYIRGGDQVTLTLTLENIGQNDASDIKVSQFIPEGFKFIKAKYTMFGIESSTYIDKNRNVKFTGNIKAGETIQLNVVLEAEHLTEDTLANSFAIIDGDSIDMIITDSVMHVIEKSENAKTDTKKNNTNTKTDDGTKTEVPSMKLSGIAWVDENENGKRDDKEPRLKNVKVTAIEAETGNIAKTISENDAITETNDQGEYIFTDLRQGKYILVFEYDQVVYTVTKYQIANASLLNSDVIERQINQDGKNKIAGVTDTIDLQKSTSNIDIGLVERAKFDLKLEKVVTKATVQNREGTKVHEYKDTSLGQIPIKGSELRNSTIAIEYKIKIKNEGNLAGYAKSIVDYKPKELTFNSNLNPKWYLGNDGNLYTTALADEIIEPGQTKEITLILTKKLTESDTGLVNNNAEIKESYNEIGIKDKDSETGNNAQGEDDQDGADVIITVRTGETIAKVSIGVVIGLALVGGINFIIRRKSAK